MSKKSKKKKESKKTKKKYPTGIEERVKSISNIVLPDVNPYKKDNEDKLDHWRPAFRTDRKSYKEKSRLAQRGNRPKKSQKPKLF